MTAQTLTSVALHVVGQYNAANKHLLQAYRAGAVRAIGSIGSAASRVDGFLGERKLPVVNEELKAGIVNAHRTVAGFLVNRLERDTDRMVGVLDTVAQRTASGIESIADVAHRTEAAFNVKASEQLRALNMPIAQIASQIADKAVEGARRIEERAAGDTIEAATTVVAKPARRVVRKG